LHPFLPKILTAACPKIGLIVIYEANPQRFTPLNERGFGLLLQAQLQRPVEHSSVDALLNVAVDAKGEGKLFP
jgi:hypothetical protein